MSDATHRTQADALEIEARAKRRLADEYDAAQEHGEEPTRAGISFWELRNGLCKYPLGAFDEPPTHFCGADAPLGEVYCIAHQRIAYNRSIDRRR